MMFRSYIALGDSFTEGVGDEWSGGEPRGWADRVAEGLSLSAVGRDHSHESPFLYANLAIRGRKLGPIIEEQVGAALVQEPDLISINGGGNDILRPLFNAKEATEQLLGAVHRIRSSGVHVLLLSGPDPADNLPLGEMFRRRGREMTERMFEAASNLEGVTLVNNFIDEGFADSTYWSEDGLHLSASGHLRVAANILDSLAISYPVSWMDPRNPQPEPKDFSSVNYYKEHIVPWVGRRLKRQSSGDGRRAKIPYLSPVEPSAG